MKKTILVVDDDQLNRQIIIDMLSAADEDYSVLSANSGEIACNLAQRLMPNLILMDWAMPGMSGIEASKEIKRNEQTKDIPIIMITGVTGQEKLDDLKPAGVDGYIAKPVNSEQLLSKVKAILG
ncbi:MAG: hypothetical protein COA57_04555 [Flavobacteriales bacterium]|nr:MAG: hypothetical protein COA57_04555 [Flavobacteriales bacterium]